jgi:hypothetical protein
MPNRSSRAIRAATLVVAATALAAPAADAADDVVAELRVIGPDGALESGTSYVTDSERIKTDRRARCFIGGEGGSGDRVRLAGPTAMGLLRTAGAANPDLKPLSVTDEFGFGLGLCGIGEVEADTGNFWSVTVNHQASQVGGDQVTLAQGDDVLWNLTGFPPDPELELTAAPGAVPGTLEVTVERWACSTAFPPPDPVCLSEPAPGATVSGGASPAVADSAGAADVSLPDAGTYTLRASLADHLDSNLARVCVSAGAAACPAPGDEPGRTILGGDKDDDFVATAGWDVVRARGGDDRISLVGGGSDRVNCGGGRDRVLITSGDDDDSIAGSCEKVRALAG